jgi:anti-sigma B factor antagonist
VDTATTITVQAGKSLDIITAAEFREKAREAIGRCPAEVIADLSGTTFMDVTGVAVLVGAHRRAGVHGVRLSVAGASEAVLRMIRVTGLSGVLDIRSNEEAATTVAGTGATGA